MLLRIGLANACAQLLVVALPLPIRYLRGMRSGQAKSCHLD